jgi:hypothetical protein
LTTSRSARLVAAMLLVCVLGATHSRADEQAEQERYRREAIERVVESHDFTMVLGAGRLYIKQQAVKSARRLLGQWGREAQLGMGWNPDAPQFRQAETALLTRAAALMARRFERTAWIKETWSEYVSASFNGEEADVIATHFESEGGRLQRQLLDWYMGEIVLFNYTFSDRIDPSLSGSEAELLALQKAAQPRLPVEDIEFASKYPDALNFVSRDPGLKYLRLLAIPLTGALTRHIDTVAREIETDLSGRHADAQPFIEAYKARR